MGGGTGRERPPTRSRERPRRHEGGRNAAWVVSWEVRQPPQDGGRAIFKTVCQFILFFCSPFLRPLMASITFFLLLAFSSSNALPARSRSPSRYASSLLGARQAADPFIYEQRFTTTFADQLNWYGRTSAATFQQRYLINASFWRSPTHPIFFYAGNEGDIELFTQNTGFLWSLAQEMGALVVFCEHRFYGQSMPYGNASYTPAHLGTLSIEHALLDYVQVVASLKANLSAPLAPVIAWGGSYGGMLAAWLRIKYPSTFAGAYASSAPILQIPGLMDPTAYNRVIRDTFATPANPLAPLALYLGFQAIINASASQQGRARVTDALRLCGTPLHSQSDVWNVLGWLSSAVGFVAMGDYPYPTSFLGPLPANPAAFIGALLPADPTHASEAALLAGLAAGANVFYNFTGQAGTCFNLSSQDPPGLQGDGWDVQCCREVVQPIGSLGWPNDPFWAAPFDLSAFVAGCEANFEGTTPRPYMQLFEYGGLDLSGASRILFFNGDLDPWKSGGIVQNSTAYGEDVIAFMQRGAAHHLDLRTPNPADPEDTVTARAMAKAAIAKWCAPGAA